MCYKTVYCWNVNWEIQVMAMNIELSTYIVWYNHDHYIGLVFMFTCKHYFSLVLTLQMHVNLERILFNDISSDLSPFEDKSYFPFLC
jgi:hypothetical protein